MPAVAPAVTTPEASIEAIVVSLVLQVPPEVVLDKVLVAPAQALRAPVIGSGAVFTDRALVL